MRIYGGGDKNMGLNSLYAKMRAIHEEFLGPLKIAKSSEAMVEYSGTIEVMQGKQKVQGHYFSSVMLKDKDVRFYFIPIYMHPEAFQLSIPLQKMLKGKSCFHLKQVDDVVMKELSQLIRLGLELLKKDGLI